mgnify:CR=1 FL=1
MKKLISLAMITIALMLTGCYNTVPAGNKGKIMGANGFQPEIYPPSKVWLTQFMTQTPEKLFLVQTTTKKYAEPFKVLLTDKLTLTGDIVFRCRITGSDKIVNGIFNDLPMNDNIVTTDEVYNIYGKMIVLNTTREIISKYNVDEVNKNYARITVELYNAIKPKLAGLPIEISDVTLGSIAYPEIVTQAIENAKKKQMAIEEEEAKVQIELTKLKGREELAQGEYRIKMIEAKRMADYNKKIAEGITPDLLELRRLDLREQELSKWNGNYPLNATTVMGGNTPVIVDSK